MPKVSIIVPVYNASLPAAARRRPGVQREPLGDGRIRLLAAAKHARARRVARTPAGGLGPQLPVAAHGRQSVADVILIADHHQHHACEDEDKGHDVGRVEDGLPADDGQNSMFLQRFAVIGTEGIIAEELFQVVMNVEHALHRTGGIIEITEISEQTRIFVICRNGQPRDGMAAAVEGPEVRFTN